MYIDKALKRLDQIDWNNVGTKGDMLDGDLFAEFLRRLAHYFQKINQSHLINPMMTTFLLYCYDETIPIKYSSVFEKLPSGYLHCKYIV